MLWNGKRLIRIELMINQTAKYIVLSENMVHPFIRYKLTNTYSISHFLMGTIFPWQPNEVAQEAISAARKENWEEDMKNWKISKRGLIKKAMRKGILQNYFEKDRKNGHTHAWRAEWP